jgi:hypothetical protein
MEDIIFENREKRYGAYFLRKNQHWHEWVALALVCGWLWAAFWGWNGLKEEPEPPTKRIEMIVSGCWFGFGEDLPSIKEYKVPILPPCPPEKKLIAFKIPQPVPAWMLCECDKFADPIPRKKLPEKLKTHPYKLWEEISDISHKDEPPHIVCDCPKPVDVTFDSLLRAEVALPKPISFAEPAQLINPEVIPTAIQRKLQNQKITISILINSTGAYRKYRLEGKLSKRLQEQLDGFAPELKFTPEIREGRASSGWVQL